MTNEARPPLDYGDLDAVAEERTSTTSASETIKKAAAGVGAVYDQARKPGMPLSILSNIVREAPLGSVFAAFVLGVAFARRR